MSNSSPDRRPGRQRGIRGVISRFLENPASIRYASVAIMTLTVVMTLMGAVILRVFDHEEYPTMGEAIWFTLQTVTTVGYGDNTPADFTGRLVAAAIMLTAIGLITVITAIITSTFVGAATKRNNADGKQAGIDTIVRLEAALQALDDRLDRIESKLDLRPPPDDE
ncbi:MAG TPA: potassium channel family protein [Ilumatobacteraceae bacterium]|nr:potassium channel family protein [Ilumatobacteraceae bacterium]